MDRERSWTESDPGQRAVLDRDQFLLGRSGARAEPGGGVQGGARRNGEESEFGDQHSLEKSSPEARVPLSRDRNHETTETGT